MAQFLQQFKAWEGMEVFDSIQRPKLLIVAVRPSTRQAQAVGNSRGLTLLEVLVAISILAVGFLGTASLVSSFMQKNVQAKRVTAATTLIQDKVENLKNTFYGSITNGSETNINAKGEVGGPYARSWTVATSGTVKTVTVTVTWSDGAVTKSKSMATAISQ